MNFDEEIPRETAAVSDSLAATSFVAQVYLWMGLALLVTSLTAVAVFETPSVAQAIFDGPVFFICIIAEIGLVIWLSAAIHKLSAFAATLLFGVYSILNGLTLSVIFFAYTTGSIASTFLICSGTFGLMSVYGFLTKRDLTSLGNLCFMGLVGVIVASVVNMIFYSESIYWITTYVGILVFVGLTAYDTQKIRQMGQAVEAGTETAHKAAILGALALYLDFINLMLLLLRLFGRRR